MNLNDAQIRAQVLEILKALAPEIKPAQIIPDQPLRAQIDLDSMDWLNVLAALHERLQVNIPETDYGKLQTLDGIVAYLAAKTPAG
ncbi:acyl carrier protein [Dechloromonas denitrificans]|uniref:acyl carrier protein n=1 Tax=Azonexaceae TaxID=2008795 RepID=UPI001CF8C8B8|nr:acyl carrier protein [Dechloromonas denitrificans]UCV04246.1 acyl carrier protein [Dechloromonas denitrificans]UCV08568.1 acyl carrier protein [Dechloromonas denitrificans]